MLDDAAAFETADGVGDPHDRVHLVGDEHHREIQFVPNVGEEP